jgi:C-terminal processing protease CtpA/Prc
VNMGRSFFLSLLLFMTSACSGLATVSLDDILSCLETNGVLVDRTQAVRGGIEGILKSIDPGACIGAGESVVEAGHGATGVLAVAAVEIWPEDIAYLKVDSLAKGSGTEILNHLRALDGKAGVILDFRGAGGADLDSVSRLAGINRSAGEQLFVVTDNQDKPLSTNVVGVGVSFHAPLMVLIDGQTRLASEALAALWHGRPGIMLIGSATAGDTRFREALTLPGGQLITLATRKFLPLEAAFDEGHGIRPDVEVADAVEFGSPMISSTNPPARPLSMKSERDRELMHRVEGDVALRRATDILLGLRTLGGYGQR